VSIRFSIKKLDPAKRKNDCHSLEIENLLNAHSEKSPYELRTDALSRELSAPEWFRALYHIAKHRGFQSNKKIKAGSKEKEKEEGALLEGVKTNALLMAEKGYRTVGEMFFLDPKFSDHKRNNLDSRLLITRLEVGHP
jgi:CRISPR-associated endonuclease Csn1